MTGFESGQLASNQAGGLNVGQVANWVATDTRSVWSSIHTCTSVNNNIAQCFDFNKSLSGAYTIS